MGRLSKGKGSGFERDLSKLLSDWWSVGKRDDLFWRSQNSGARATSRGKQGKTTKGQGGDICATDPDSVPWSLVFSTEAKRGYGASLAEMLDRPDHVKGQNLMEDWIQQAHEDKEVSGSVSWIIMMRRDHKNAMVIMPYDIYLELKDQGAFSPRPAIAFDVHFPVRFTKEKKKKGKKPEVIEHPLRLFSTTLDTFLDEVTPRMIRAIAKKYQL